MAGFVSAMTDILAIDLVLDTTTYTLGGIALGVILLGAGVKFFKSLKGSR